MGLIGRIVLGRRDPRCPRFSREILARHEKLIRERNEHTRRNPEPEPVEARAEWVNPPARQAPEILPVAIPVAPAAAKMPSVRAVPRTVTPVITFHDLEDPE